VTKDEILQALHLLAMGRKHPLHDQLAEKLGALFAEPEPDTLAGVPIEVANAIYEQGNFPALKETGRQARAARKPTDGQDGRRQTADAAAAQEDNSAAFTWGALAKEREQSMREYYRMPYGTEVDGWSSIVTSDVQDTIEWILPALLKIFTSTDQAVSFDPVPTGGRAGRAAGHGHLQLRLLQAKRRLSHVLYTAFKDALTVKNCAVMWRKETKRVKTIVPVKGASKRCWPWCCERPARMRRSRPRPPRKSR
jgi:hypothetical protein